MNRISPRLAAIRSSRLDRAWGHTLSVWILISILGTGSGSALDVPLYGQRGDVWCWAASSEMVLDYIAKGDVTNQCELVRSVKPDPDKCKCNPPNGQSAESPLTCNLADPFGLDDYIPKLLGPASVLTTHQITPSTTNTAPLNRATLSCEIKRERPVLVWWKQKQVICAEMGHLVVARDFVPSTEYGDLVLINDPMPLKKGSVYWLTWRGFSCGNGLGGHCIDYFNIKPPPTPPVTCSAEPELDSSGCSADAADWEKVASFDAAEAAIPRLLSGPGGDRIRKGLELPPSIQHIQCNQHLRIHGAWIEYSPQGEMSVNPIPQTRLLCTLWGWVWQSPASILLLDRPEGGWLLAGFGAETTSSWFQDQAESLIVARANRAAKQGVAMPDIIDLYEVEIPGTGDILLLDKEGPEIPTIHFLTPETGPRRLREVLTDPAAGLGSESLETWLKRLKREPH